MKEYGSYNNLLRHYRGYKRHRPDNLETKRTPNAKEIVSDVLLSHNISQISRSAKINAFVSCLSDDEIKKYFLQRAVNVVSPWEFLLAKVVIGRQSGRKSTQASLGAWMSRGIGSEQLGLRGCGAEKSTREDHAW